MYFWSCWSPTFFESRFPGRQVELSPLFGKSIILPFIVACHWNNLLFFGEHVIVFFCTLLWTFFDAPISFRIRLTTRYFLTIFPITKPCKACLRFPAKGREESLISATRALCVISFFRIFSAFCPLIPSSLRSRSAWLLGVKSTMLTSETFSLDISSVVLSNELGVWDEFGEGESDEDALIDFLYAAFRYLWTFFCSCLFSSSRFAILRYVLEACRFTRFLVNWIFAFARFLLKSSCTIIGSTTAEFSWASFFLEAPCRASIDSVVCWTFFSALHFLCHLFCCLRLTASSFLFNKAAGVACG